MDVYVLVFGLKRGKKKLSRLLLCPQYLAQILDM